MKFQRLAMGVLCAGAMSMVAVQAEEATTVKEHGKGITKEKSKFEVADTDGNGSISMEEFKVLFAKRQLKNTAKAGEATAPAPTAEEQFNQFDTDKSGSLSKEELKAGHEKGKKPHKADKNDQKAGEEKTGAN